MVDNLIMKVIGNVCYLSEIWKKFVNDVYFLEFVFFCDVVLVEVYRWFLFIIEILLLGGIFYDNYIGK